jgi:hypothetical protein
MQSLEIGRLKNALLGLVVITGLVGCSAGPPDPQQLDVMVRKAIVEQATTPPLYFHEGRTAPPNPFIPSTTEINLDKLLLREGWITAKIQGQWMYVALTPKGKSEVAKAGWKKMADPAYSKGTVWVIPRETDEFDSYAPDKPEATPDKISVSVGWKRKQTPIELMLEDYILQFNPQRSDLMIKPLYTGTVVVARGSDGWKVESVQSDVSKDFGSMIQR